MLQLSNQNVVHISVDLASCTHCFTHHLVPFLLPLRCEDDADSARFLHLQNKNGRNGKKWNTPPLSYRSSSPPPPPYRGLHHHHHHHHQDQDLLSLPPPPLLITFLFLSSDSSLLQLWGEHLHLLKIIVGSWKLIFADWPFFRNRPCLAWR